VTIILEKSYTAQHLCKYITIYATMDRIHVEYIYHLCIQISRDLRLKGELSSKNYTKNWFYGRVISPPYIETEVTHELVVLDKFD
jgi:hypothetical protein